jgi:hypothetical protein
MNTLNIQNFTDEVNTLSNLFMAHGIKIPQATLFNVFSQFKGYKNWDTAQSILQTTTNLNTQPDILLNLILSLNTEAYSSNIDIIGMDGNHYRVVWFNSEHGLEELEELVLEGLKFEDALKECDTSLVEILPLNSSTTEDGVFLYLSDIFNAKRIDEVHWIVQDFFTIIKK